MDALKHRAGEKLEALHVAAVTVAGNGKTRVEDAYNQTAEALQKIHEIFHAIWHHELMSESRARAARWAREALQRLRDGAPPLSPVQLYEELRALLHDRVWRRTVFVFLCGAAAGAVAGVALGMRARAGTPRGPHARALHAQNDHSVLLVDDHSVPGAGWGEVLVRVQSFSVCALDRRALRGRGAGLRALARHPVLVGRAFAGVVLDAGPGVADLELGDAVWGCVGEWDGGAASELLTVRSTRVSKRPLSLSADAAASLPRAGAAALSALHTLQYSPESAKGKRVAVCGAASGEGLVLAQLLGVWGARVAACAPRHAAHTLLAIGVSEFIDAAPVAGAGGADVAGGASGAGGAGGAAGAGGAGGACEWAALEAAAARGGPWDALLTCGGARVPAGRVCNTKALLKSTSSSKNAVDLRPRPFWSDRLPGPLHLMFAASFYTYRMLRWMVGRGTDTDWLEDRYRLREGLDTLTQLVESGHLTAVLDKVYLPQDFETALAHACSDEAIGTTVIRFP